MRCCWTILRTACDDGNWIIRSQFAEAVFAGTWRARLIGADAFSETGHTLCEIYLWADLQTHRVLQGYIELDVTTHPKISYVVVEHLIQTRVHMAMPWLNCNQNWADKILILQNFSKEMKMALKK
jgi:hypothetical protein